MGSGEELVKGLCDIIVELDPQVRDPLLMIMSGGAEAALIANHESVRRALIEWVDSGTATRLIERIREIAAG